MTSKTSRVTVRDRNNNNKNSLTCPLLVQGLKRCKIKKICAEKT